MSRHGVHLGEDSQEQPLASEDLGVSGLPMVLWLANGACPETRLLCNVPEQDQESRFLGSRAAFPTKYWASLSVFSPVKWGFGTD